LLFERELEDALQLLLVMPGAGTKYPTSKRPNLRRLLLPKTEYHIYFALERNDTTLVIHSVWGARRGRGPRL
jgi:plasmid stabilization system protein ParE